jgi:hypothetical protein
MTRNSGEQFRNLVAGATSEQDSKKITDLIAQLDRDLEETQKSAIEKG